jgi:hypothetical protein
MSKKKTVPANFQIGDDEKLEFTTSKRDRWLIPFLPIGREDSRYPESINAGDLISKFSKAEQFLYREVLRHKDERNNVRIRKKAYSTADQDRLKRAIPKWKEKNLFVSYKREHYMINPWFLVPQQRNTHLETITRWNELKASQAAPKSRKPAASKG